MSSNPNPNTPGGRRLRSGRVYADITPVVSRPRPPLPPPSPPPQPPLPPQPAPPTPSSDNGGASGISGSSSSSSSSSSPSFSSSSSSGASTPVHPDTPLPVDVASANMPQMLGFPPTPAAAAQRLPTYFEYMQLNLSSSLFRPAYDSHKGGFYWIMMIVLGVLCVLIFEDPAEETYPHSAWDDGGLSKEWFFSLSSSALWYYLACDRIVNACLGMDDMFNAFFNHNHGLGVFARGRSALCSHGRKILEPIMFVVSALYVGHLLGPNVYGLKEVAAARVLGCVILFCLELFLDAAECSLAGKGYHVPLFPAAISLFITSFMILSVMHSTSRHLTGRHWEAAKSYGVSTQVHSDDVLPLPSTTLIEGIDLGSHTLPIPPPIYSADFHSDVETIHSPSGPDVSITPYDPAGQSSDEWREEDSIRSENGMPQDVSKATQSYLSEPREGHITPDKMIVQHAREGAHRYRKPTEIAEDESPKVVTASTSSKSGRSTPSLSDILVASGLLRPFLSHGFLGGFRATSYGQPQASTKRSIVNPYYRSSTSTSLNTHIDTVPTKGLHTPSSTAGHLVISSVKSKSMRQPAPVTTSITGAASMPDTQLSAGRHAIPYTDESMLEPTK